MRRRLALFLIPVALLVWLLRPRVPTERPLQLHFGSHAADVREADLHFERDARLARDVTLYFPEGAPSDAGRTVRLAAGNYEVGVRVVLGGGRERHLTRSVHLEGDQAVDLDLDTR